MKTYYNLQYFTCEGIPTVLLFKMEEVLGKEARMLSRIICLANNTVGAIRKGL